MTSFAAFPKATYDPSFARMRPNEQRLEMYLRSAPDRNSEGLFRLRFGAVEDDIGLSRSDALEALQGLLRAGRPFKYDPTAGLILDLDALKTQPIGRKDFQPIPEDDWAGKAAEATEKKKRDRRLKGAVDKLRTLPESPLLLELHTLAKKFSPEFAHAIEEAFPSPFEAPSKPRVEASSYEESRVEEAGSPRFLAEEELGAEIVQMNRRRPS